MKQALDENVVVETIIINLSKTLVCIPHDLLTAKLYPHRFCEKSDVFLY